MAKSNAALAYSLPFWATYGQISRHIRTRDFTDLSFEFSGFTRMAKSTALAKPPA